MQSHVKLESVRSSWLNCALRGDEAVYWVSEGQQWLAVLNQYRALFEVIGSVEGINAFIY